MLIDGKLNPGGNVNAPILALWGITYLIEYLNVLIVMNGIMK